ncbi:hypothetical protein ACIQF6_28190 [Kitasatospora sp. NPDC092948]|uniref:hypothetical protein n=1 Tax=Kitasatospora sp. NPDC092948 TaxID=3364088 RepID=UPI0038227266
MSALARYGRSSASGRVLTVAGYEHSASNVDLSIPGGWPMVDHGDGWERDLSPERTGYSPSPAAEPDLDRTHRILRMIVDDVREQLERLGEPVAALGGRADTAEALLRRTLARIESYAAPAGALGHHRPEDCPERVWVGTAGEPEAFIHGRCAMGAPADLEETRV